MSFKIAVDGPAASGKGTLAKTLAMALSCDYLDTGTLYRAVARDVKDAKLAVNDTPEAVAEIVKIATALALPISQDEGLRTSEIAQIASKIAAMPDVRHALVAKQRDFASTPPSGQGEGRSRQVPTKAIQGQGQRRPRPATAFGSRVFFR